MKVIEVSNGYTLVDNGVIVLNHDCDVTVLEKIPFNEMSLSNQELKLLEEKKGDSSYNDSTTFFLKTTYKQVHNYRDVYFDIEVEALKIGDSLTEELEDKFNNNYHRSFITKSLIYMAEVEKELFNLCIFRNKKLYHKESKVSLSYINHILSIFDKLDTGIILDDRLVKILLTKY